MADLDLEMKIMTVKQHNWELQNKNKIKSTRILCSLL